MIPSLLRATSPAASQPFLEFVGSHQSPGSRFLDVDPEPRPLPSTGVTRLHQYYGPFRHPDRPDLALTGCLLGRHPSHQSGLPVFQTILLYMHASVITPTEPPGQTSLDVRKTAAFPELWAGRLPQLVVSRPAQRSLAFRPAYSPGHLCDPLHQRLRRIRYLLRRSDCYRVERLVPGWESHPLRIAGFSRRTTKTDINSSRRRRMV